jgi:hypothetical protein
MIYSRLTFKQVIELYDDCNKVNPDKIELGLKSQSQILEQSAMSRSKHLRSKSWLAAWKKKD